MPERKETEKLIAEIMSNHFEGLNTPSCVSLGLFAEGDYRYVNRGKIVSILRDNGINAVLYDSPKAQDITKFIVDETGIKTPLLSPQNAVNATHDIIQALVENDIDIAGYALPQTNSSLSYSVIKEKENITKEIIPDERAFIAEQLKQAEKLPAADFTGSQSLFRGGTLGDKPYAVVSSFSRARDCAYGTADIETAKMYTGTDKRSWAGRAHYKEVDGKTYGFLYEYEKADNQKFYDNYGIESRKAGGFYETPIFEHRNKLKGVYLDYNNRIVQIAGADGKYINREWEHFASLHAPVSSNFNSNIVARDNNLKIAAEKGEIRPDWEKSLITENVGEKKATNAADAAIKIEQKLAARETAQIVGKKTKRNFIIAQAAAANAKFDKAVDAAIIKGEQVLNKSKVGKAYSRGTAEIAKSHIVKAVTRKTEKAIGKVAQTTVGRTVTKVVAKTTGSAVGKSILKKIPLVSIGAGCWFAWNRIKNGEYKSAGCEVVSGICGCFPGIGTAASTAIDVGLAAKDIREAIDTAEIDTSPITVPGHKTMPKDLSQQIEERLKAQNIQPAEKNAAKAASPVIKNHIAQKIASSR